VPPRKAEVVALFPERFPFDLPNRFRGRSEDCAEHGTSKRMARRVEKEKDSYSTFLEAICG